LAPNPAHDKVTVSVNSQHASIGNCSMQLFDVHANCFRTFKLTVNGNKTVSETIDLQNLAAGIYIYKILNLGKGIYDGKLVVN